MDTLFQILVMTSLILLVISVGLILYLIIRGVKEWRKNNQAKILDLNAKVVSKRTETTPVVAGQNQAASMITSHFITFEFDNKNRIELNVLPKLANKIAVNDCGVLTYQRTRFLNFQPYGSC